MNEKNSSEDAGIQVKALIAAFKPKTRRFAQLVPLKTEIRELRKQRAGFDDIRLILLDANIKVSKSTICRFCRSILGQKSRRPYKPRVRNAARPQIGPVLSQSESIEAALLERRDRIPGPWRKKRGPHIADTKNL